MRQREKQRSKFRRKETRMEETERFSWRIYEDLKVMEEIGSVTQNQCAQAR